MTHWVMIYDLFPNSPLAESEGSPRSGGQPQTLHKGHIPLVEYLCQLNGGGRPSGERTQNLRPHLCYRIQNCCTNVVSDLGCADYFGTC